MTPTEMERYLNSTLSPGLTDRDVMKYLYERVKMHEHRLENIAQQMFDLRTKAPIIPIIETEANHQQLPPITDIT